MSIKIKFNNILSVMNNNISLKNEFISTLNAKKSDLIISTLNVELKIVY